MPAPGAPPALAQHTAGPGPPRIAYAQVGLSSSHPADVALRLPALIQCFYDAVSWFGDIEISAIQVKALSITPSPSSCLGDLLAPTIGLSLSPKAG